MTEGSRRTTSGNGGNKEVARQQGQEVRDTAQDAAANVGGTAKERGRDVRHEAEQHARSIANDASRQLRRQAQDETQRAGTALESAASQLRALAEGRAEDAGVFGDYADRAADSVNQWAQTVNERGFDGLVADLRSYGRRRPGAFLFGAFAAGIVVSRFGRNAADELRQGDGESSRALGSGGEAPGPMQRTPSTPSTPRGQSGQSGQSGRSMPSPESTRSPQSTQRRMS